MHAVRRTAAGLQLMALHKSAAVGACTDAALLPAGSVLQQCGTDECGDAFANIVISACGLPRKVFLIAHVACLASAAAPADEGEHTCYRDLSDMCKRCYNMMIAA